MLDFRRRRRKRVGKQPTEFFSFQPRPRPPLFLSSLFPLSFHTRALQRTRALALLQKYKTNTDKDLSVALHCKKQTHTKRRRGRKTIFLKLHFGARVFL